MSKSQGTNVFLASVAVSSPYCLYPLLYSNAQCGIAFPPFVETTLEVWAVLAPAGANHTVMCV